MSLAPVIKIMTLIESPECECPEVLSMDQILRMLSVFAFLALVMALFGLSSALNTGS
jgi:hypothetical protein